MRVVVQRVLEAGVSINGKLKASIGNGLLVMVGIEDADNEDDLKWLSNKLVNLRIFNDEAGVPNKSVIELGGEILLISQFTLHALTKKGNRPSYIRASKLPHALPLYRAFIARITSEFGKPICTGEFGADMQVNLINNGPINLIIDSKNKDL